jgi:hypothetical protein
MYLLSSNKIKKEFGSVKSITRVADLVDWLNNNQKVFDDMRFFLCSKILHPIRNESMSDKLVKN